MWFYILKSLECVSRLWTTTYTQFWILWNCIWCCMKYIFNFIVPGTVFCLIGLISGHFFIYNFFPLIWSNRISWIDSCEDDRSSIDLFVDNLSIKYQRKDVFPFFLLRSSNLLVKSAKIQNVLVLKGKHGPRPRKPFNQWTFQYFRGVSRPKQTKNLGFSKF